MKFDQNSLMILLRKEGAHGVSARFEKVRMLLPQRSYESAIAPLLQAKLTLLAQCEVSDVIYYNSKFVISRNLENRVDVATRAADARALGNDRPRLAGAQT